MNLEPLVQNRIVRKPLARSRNGVVAGQSRIAAAGGGRSRLRRMQTHGLSSAIAMAGRRHQNLMVTPAR